MSVFKPGGITWQLGKRGKTKAWSEFSDPLGSETALGAAAMAAGHVGGGPRLIDEHEALGLQIELVVEPLFALPQDVGPVLLDGMASLFLRVMPRRAKKR